MGGVASASAVFVLALFVCSVEGVTLEDKVKALQDSLYKKPVMHLNMDKFVHFSGLRKTRIGAYLACSDRIWNDQVGNDISKEENNISRKENDISREKVTVSRQVTN